MRVVVYIDGFNLYYGCLKGTPYKWLDVSKLSNIFAKDNTIVDIRYFTARVIARPDDQQQPLRQQIYLRALRTIQNVKIIEGHFLSHAVWMPEVDENKQLLGRKVRVLKTEEKGSDVNLASHMLVDAFNDRFDIAFVISNDTDLLTPIKFIRGDLRKKVAFINPQKRPSFILKNNSDYFYQIQNRHLKACQFNVTLNDHTGIFHKPKDW